MKKTQNMQKALSLFFAAAFLSVAGLLAQPVVQVPPGCNVVVPGSGPGVTTGFGGIVGSGGMVVMPDPYPGDFFTVIPNATTILGWSLLGDLSVQQSLTPPSAPIQTVPSGVLTENIMSYNKNLRPSEATPPSLPTLARSKGRIIIAYNDISTLCGGSIQFDILKEYTNTGSGATYVPPIVGPECLEPNTTYTYSVDQIASDNLPDGIGLDEYYWTIPGSFGSFYNSADKSSITFTTPPSVAGPDTIRCCFGRANPWDANILTPLTCVEKVIGIQPAFPTFINPIPTCVNTGSPYSFSASLSPLPGHTYTWTASNASWVLTPSGTQGENLAVSSMGDDPGVITLTITYGSCNPSVFTFPIERSFVPPLSITSASGSCLSAGSSYNFYISPSAVNNYTCWTLPTGWTSTNVNGSGSSISVTIPPGTLAGAYTISAYSCSCSTSTISTVVNVRPATPVITSGPACVDRNAGTPVVYTSTSSPGAGSYSWSFVPGWTCIGGCTGTSPVVIPGGTGSGPVNITVTAVGTSGCNAVSAPYPVNYNPVTPGSVTVGCWNFGINGNTQVTVGNYPGYGSYTVTATPSSLLLGFSVNPVTGVITLNTSGAAAAGSYTLSITHVTASCGSSSTVNVPVTFGGNGASLAAYYDSSPSGSDVYIVGGAPGGSTYQWLTDGTPVPGVTVSFLGLSGPSPGPGQVCVNVQSAGCTTQLCTTGGTHSRPLVGEEEIEAAFEQAAQVYPNPNNGSFVVKLPVVKQSAEARLIDSNGREIGTYKLGEGENRIHTGGKLSAGMYLLLLNVDERSTVHKIQIL